MPSERNSKEPPCNATMIGMRSSTDFNKGMSG